MAINKVVYGTNTLIDLTDATATADKILQGYTAYGADGTKLTGTATGGGSGDGYVWQDAQGYVHLSDEEGTSVSVEALSVTANGTYTAPSGTAYSPVTVNVSGGASAWTKVAETSYQVSGSSTTAVTVAKWETGHSEIWTSDKIVYVRIRDTVGKRAGYFYGTDTFFLNIYPANSSTNTSTALGSIIDIWSVDTGTGNPYAQRHGYSTTGYGVYPSMFYSDGSVQISYRANSTYSRTIDSIYSVEVYLLDPPTGTSIFT